MLSCRAVTEAAEASDHLPVVAVVRPRPLVMGQVAAAPVGPPAAGEVTSLLGQ